MSIRYEAAPSKPEEILKLIAKVASGRKLLEAFLPLLAKRKVTIEAYPLPLLAKLREVLIEGQPIGACYIRDPAKLTGTIFLDFGSPLGVLAPFLVHEIVHALDPRIASAQVTPTREVRNETELSAFQTQFLFTQELKDRDPAYEEFLRTYYPKARILNELLEPAEIDALYGT